MLKLHYLAGIFSVDHPRVFFITIAHEKKENGGIPEKEGTFWRKKNVSENLFKMDVEGAQCSLS